MNRPLLSVVITASDSRAAVDRVLNSLRSHLHSPSVEFIVVGAKGRIASLESENRAIWIEAESGAGVHRLRRIGLERANAPLVAFIEDSCSVQAGWLEAWVSAFERLSLLAATGPVECDAGERGVDWAVFFCEYAPFLGPSKPIAASRLAGNNFAVRRDWAITQSGPDGVHEGLIQRLAAEQGETAIVAAARVQHVRRFTLRQAIEHRFRFGLEFGRLRARGARPLTRLIVLPAGPAILGSQLARLLVTLIRKRRHGGRWLEHGPITCALLTAWSVGEWLGWVTGRAHPIAGKPGGSAARHALRPAGRIRSQRRDCEPSPASA